MTKQDIKNKIKELAILRSVFPIQWWKMILGEVERIENDIKNPKVATEQDIERVIKKLADSMAENLKYQPENWVFQREYQFYMDLLPKAISEEETTEIVQKLITKTGMKTKKEKGALMQSLKLVKGLDMRLAAQILDKNLN